MVLVTHDEAPANIDRLRLPARLSLLPGFTVVPQMLDVLLDDLRQPPCRRAITSPAQSRNCRWLMLRSRTVLVRAAGDLPAAVHGCPYSCARV